MKISCRVKIVFNSASLESVSCLKVSKFTLILLPYEKWDRKSKYFSCLFCKRVTQNRKIANFELMFLFLSEIYVFSLKFSGTVSLQFWLRFGKNPFLCFTRKIPPCDWFPLKINTAKTLLDSRKKMTLKKLAS